MNFYCGNVNMVWLWEQIQFLYTAHPFTYHLIFSLPTRRPLLQRPKCGAVTDRHVFQLHHTLVHRSPPPSFYLWHSCNLPATTAHIVCFCPLHPDLTPSTFPGGGIRTDQLAPGGPATPDRPGHPGCRSALLPKLRTPPTFFLLLRYRNNIRKVFRVLTCFIWRSSWKVCEFRTCFWLIFSFENLFRLGSFFFLIYFNV